MKWHRMSHSSRMNDIWMRDTEYMNECMTLNNSLLHVHPDTWLTHSHASWHVASWVCHTHTTVNLSRTDVGMSHVAFHESCHTRMNKLRCTYGWVMSHIWMSHVTHMNESCHIFEWVWIGHVTCMNVPSGLPQHVTHVLSALTRSLLPVSHTHTYERVTTHICTQFIARIYMSRGTQMNESHHTCAMRPDTKWLIHSYVWVTSRHI